MRPIYVLLISLVAGAIWLLVRYLRNRSSAKDSNYGGVQYTARWTPPPPPPESFLPGSRRTPDPEEARIAQEILAQGPVIEQMAPARRQTRRPLLSRRDLKRTFILEAILDKPKWKDF
jgi:hypothetical protein